MNLSISSSRGLIALFLVAVAATLMVLVAASEWLVRTKVTPEDTLFKHVALFNNASSPYAAFGDSHVARNFYALAPVINLGYSSENIQQMSWKAERYLQRTPHPKIILLQADPHLFSEYRTESGLQGYPQIFSTSKGWRLWSLSDQYRPQLPALWRAFAGNGGKLISDIEFTPQGAMLSPGNLSQWTQAQTDSFINVRAPLHVPSVGFEHSQDAALYSGMVHDFVKAGAKICLVAFPVAPVYRARVLAQNPHAQAQFDRATNFFKALADDPKVHFIDHRTLFDDPSLYRDPDHLNMTGARAYGPLLQSECFGNARDKTTPEVIALQR